MRYCHRITVLCLGLALFVWAGCAASAADEKPPDVVLYPKHVSKKAATTQARIQFLKTFSTSADLEPAPDNFTGFVTGRKRKAVPIGKPYGIATLPGAILVCDPSAGHVVILDLEKQAFRTFGDGLLVKPHAIAVDLLAKRIYVSDLQRGEVLVFDTQFAYEGRLWETPQTPSPGSDTVRMKPVGMVLRGNELFVGDLTERKIKVYHKDTGAFIRKFGFVGGEKNDLFWPTNLAVDPEGRIFVTDTLKATVQMYTPKGEWLEPLGQLGLGHGKFVRPKGIAIDRTGITYVVDAAFENVQMFDEQKRLLLFFPEAPGNHPGGLNLPTGIAVDYTNLKYFEPYVAPGYALRHLILVASQFGNNKVNVYGLVVPVQVGEMPSN